LEVYYNSNLRNWDKAIEQELKRRGLRHGQVTVICRPKKAVPAERIAKSINKSMAMEVTK
jgi:hypothetical protein